jgi:hypothetical protein
MNFVSDHHLHSFVEIHHILDVLQEIYDEPGLHFSLLLRILDVLELI